MFHSIYTAGPNGFWVFVLCTVVLGAGAAYVTGKAIADTWRPYWHIIMYALALTLVVRFMHYALFDEVMVSLGNFIVDAAVLVPAAMLGHAVARRRQMATQYSWPTGR
jgi:hypothetical protein